MSKIYLYNKNMSHVKELISIHNGKRADYDIEIIKSAKEIGIGEIFDKLKQIIKKSDNGIEKLARVEILEKLQKVPIDDFYDMVCYLYENNMKHEMLTNIYVSKIINLVNKSDYCGMVKNYITKLYFDSGDELYNWMSCCIKINVLTVPFKERYADLISHLKNFIKFYNIKNSNSNDDSVNNSDDDSNDNSDDNSVYD